MTGDRIRNIGIFAHVDAGKTTVTEQLLYLCGQIRRPGSVDEGSTQTDFDPIERQRGISVFSACAVLRWEDHTINLIDTPGHTDFAGEAERSLAAMDGAVLVVSAVEGVQSHTESLLRAFIAAGTPFIAFINKIDRAGSRTAEAAAEIARICGRRTVMLNLPEGEETRGCAARDNPELYNELYETIADYNEEVAERFLRDLPPDPAQLRDALAACTADCKTVPVLCGSAMQGVGIRELLRAMTLYLPPAARFAQPGLSALVYKIRHDKTMGKLAYVRMFGGELKSRDTVTLRGPADVGPDEPPGQEKIAQIRKTSGSRAEDTGHVAAGDIAVLCGLQRAAVGDVIGAAVKNRFFPLAHPFLRVKASPKNETELPSLVRALGELCDEEPYIRYSWEKSEREAVLSITGEIQLEIISALLLERYGLEASFSRPSVIYKETPAKAGYGFEAYTMPKPCWAVVKLFLEPLPRGSGVVFDRGNVSHNKLFYKYQTHIEQCFFQSLGQGIRGWELTDFKATLADGEHHTIHTHPLDFFVATPMALLDGLRNTGTALLEPYVNLRLSAAEELLGRVISDMVRMRAEFDSPAVREGVFTLEASVPAAECLDYPVQFASLTSGRGRLFSDFGGYRDCPEGKGESTPWRGICPLDRAKWILYKRGAIQ